MPNGGVKQVIKQLSIDTLMALIFLALLGFAVWLIYIFYFRGPIDIETRGFVTRTIRTEEVQPIQVEKYRVSHFHNLDDVVLNGIPSKSLCVKCHSDYPHAKDKKIRSFLNAHSWFMACEACHMKPKEGEQLDYRWLESGSGEPLTKLSGQPGVYGGLIVPLKIENGQQKRLDVLDDKEQVFVEEFIRLNKNLDDYQIKWSQERIHKMLAKKAVFCDECHTREGLFDFRQLLYAPSRVSHLKSLDMASMIKTYKEFHLPSVLDTR